MKLLRKLCLIMLFAPLNSQAYTYIQTDLMLLTLDIKPEFLSGSFEANPLGVALRLGNYFNPNFAVEGMIALGLGDDSIENSSLDAGLSSMFGVYGVAAVPVSSIFSIFGKAGYVTITYEDTDADKIEGDGFSYGFGANFNITPYSAIVLEYVIFPETKYDWEVFLADVPADSDTINIGFQAKF